MIIFKKFGETVKITNADWKKMRARFNPHNAILRGEFYRIERECTFCLKHNHNVGGGNCIGCPFDVFSDGVALGCLIFFNKIFVRDGMVFNTEGIDELTWTKDCDLEARTQLCEIQKMMEKIEASQERKEKTV